MLVVDAGSADATAALALGMGARVVTAPRGRGIQLNRGALQAKGDVLWFVHADTLVPETSGNAVREAIRSGFRAGAFAVRFDAPGWKYRLGSKLASARSRCGGLALGDQAIFVERKLFRESGGFPAWPLFEDVALWRSLRRVTRVCILEPPVLTSARRFKKLGPLRTVLLNWTLLLLFECGVSPERLARWYRSIR